MEEPYQQYIIRHLAEAENALFEARNAMMGYNDSKARSLDKMRIRVVDMLLNEKRRQIAQEGR